MSTRIRCLSGRAGACRLGVGVILGLMLALLAGVGAGVQAAPAASADNGSAQFSLRPVTYDPSNPTTASYFIFGPQPGAVVQSQVRVSNGGTARGSAALYAVDATTGQTSGAVYLSRQDPKADVGAWISLGTQQVTLDPGQSQEVSFSVTVPGNARPGQHLGGIVAENEALQQGSNSGPVQINIQHLSVIAVQINLPGAQTQKLEATSIKPGGEHGYQILYVGLHNSGNVMLKPSGTLQVSDASGHQQKTMKLSLDTFLPQTAIAYPVYVSGNALANGQYTAVLTLNYGNGQALHYTTPFEVTPASLHQTFGSQAPTTPPGAQSGSVLVGAAVGVASAIALILALLLVALFVPVLRAQLPFLQPLYARLSGARDRSRAVRVK